MSHLRPVGNSLYFADIICSWNFQDGWAQHLRGAFQRRNPVCFGREDEKGSSWKKGNFICGGLGGATLHRYMIKYHGKSQVFPLNLGSFEFSGFFKLKVFTSPIPYSMIFQLSNANMTSFPSPKTVACTRWDVVFCMFRVSCLGNRVFVGFNTSFVSSKPCKWLGGPWLVEGATKSSCPTDQEEAMPLSRGGPENSAELPRLQFGNFSVKQEPIEPDVITMELGSGEQGGNKVRRWARWKTRKMVS